MSATIARPASAARSRMSRRPASRQRPAETRSTRCSCDSNASEPGSATEMERRPGPVVVDCTFASIAMPWILARNHESPWVDAAVTTRSLVPRDDTCLYFALSVVDTGVDRGVGHVYQQVDENEGHRDHQNRPLDRRIVASADGGDDISSETRPTEDGLREERAGDQRAKLETDRGHDRN